MLAKSRAKRNFLGDRRSAAHGGAHALLAAHLNGTVFFSSLALLAVVGSRHQDYKLLQRGGEAYQHFLATTSMLPFAAIISGRQRLAWSELPWRGLSIGLAVAWALRTAHQWILAYDGALALGAVLIFVIFAGIASVVSARRGRARQRSADAHTPTNLHDAAGKAV
jgi:NnrU protein